MFSKASLRRWWHVHLVTLTLLVALAAFAAGTSSSSRTVFGQHLTGAGVKVYDAARSHGIEQPRTTPGEELPFDQAAELAAKNNAVPALTPMTLATPEPSMGVQLVRNYSSRNGRRPVLLVVHDTESPNAAGTQDLKAIAAWFNNPSSQASSNYVTDADGNTLELVPETAKAWTQSWFNGWAISDELIGYASQRSWPDAQLRAVARVFAAAAARWGIPVQRGAVSGCSITRPGIVQHSDLGACGGGHHDAGASFPVARFVKLVHDYRYAAAPDVKPRPAPKPAWYSRALKLDPMWSWFTWRDHGHPAGLRPTNVPKLVPAAWWARYATHLGN